MTKILILGGGFGGIRTALNLHKRLGHRKDIKITLIDRNNYQIFYPSLYEVAAAYGMTHDDPYNTKLRSTISIPFSKIFQDTAVETAQGEITSINLIDKKVTTQGEHNYDFDYLVLAFGSEVSTFGIPGVSEYAYKFKTVDDALLLFQDIEERYKSANSSDLPIKYLVAGAGFTGIELACELSLCTTHIAHKHKIFEDKCTKLMLMEATPQILPMVSDRERNLIKKRIARLGIEIIENSPIAEITDKNTAKLKNGEIVKSDFIIWSAGVKSPELLKNISGLELNPTGRIFVNNYLQINNHPNIFAIGDNIIFNDVVTGKPVPQMAFLAIKQGSLVAKNIASLVLKNSGPKEYKPINNVWVAPVGGKHAVAHTKLMDFTGLLGYLLRELIDARYFFSILNPSEALKLVYNRFTVFIRND